MSLFNAVSLLIALVAVCGYLNARFVKLPDVIGITAVGLILSVLMAIVGNKHPEWTRWAQTTLNELDFTEIVFHGMLGMLLFAGSLHVNFSDLKGEKWVILPLATLGVLISTTLVGTAFYYATHWLGAEPVRRVVERRADQRRGDQHAQRRQRQDYPLLALEIAEVDVETAREQQHAEHAVEYDFGEIQFVQRGLRPSRPLRVLVADDRHQHRQDQPDGGDADHVRQLDEARVEIAADGD